MQKVRIFHAGQSSEKAHCRYRSAAAARRAYQSPTSAAGTEQTCRRAVLTAASGPMADIGGWNSCCAPPSNGLA